MSPRPFLTPPLAPSGSDPMSDDPSSHWDEVSPHLEACFLQLVPSHLYDQFLDAVLRQVCRKTKHHFNNMANSSIFSPRKNVVRMLG